MEKLMLVPLPSKTLPPSFGPQFAQHSLYVGLAPCPVLRSTQDLPCSTAERPREGPGPPKALAISHVPQSQHGAGWKGSLQVMSFPQA